MKNYACFFNLSPFVSDAIERIEQRASALGHALEIVIRDRFEDRGRKDRALYIDITDATTPERRALGRIPCRASQLSAIVVALSLLAGALAPNGCAARGLGLATL